MGNFHGSRLQNVFYLGYSVICRRTKWMVSYVVIIFRKRKSRLYNYDMKVDGQPFKVGFFIPQQEWDLECLSRKQEADEMFYFGTNSNGECLALQIARECTCDSSALFLKTNGCTYTLPMKLNFLITEDKRTFGNSRFYTKCIAPFRKWKIFFNGMLREICPGRDQDRIVHVRFSFIWIASSGVFDFPSDYSSYNMADILSEIKWNSFKPPVDRILSVLNEYHQPGMLLGFVQIGNNDQEEVVLWGCRRHTFSTPDEYCGRYLDIFGNAENGFFFYFKIMSFDAFLIKRNISGYIMLPNGSLEAIRFITVRKIVKSKKTILFFRIKTGDHYINVSTFFYGYGQFWGKGVREKMSVSVIDVSVNGIWGSGIAIEKKCMKTNMHKTKCSKLSSFLKSRSILELLNPLVITLAEPDCLDRQLTGNLGSSLAKLMKLTAQIPGYEVPHGLVITTIGYQEFYSPIEESIFILKENFSKYDADQLKHLCERTVEEVSNSYIPPELYDTLCQKFNEIGGYSDGESFNIYPSIIGSNPEAQLLSAYFEMFTDVVGLSEIVKCIKKCWASQFSFGAIQCKMSTGQLLNVPMAIVVQKRILFNTSGIITTCDSRSGNPSVMTIREELDKFNTGAIHIIVLERGLKDNLKFVGNGILYDRNAHLNKNNLSKDLALTLGKLACKLEKGFRLPLCVEWSLKENKFYVIQVRPITLVNEDNKTTLETKLEILHYYDSYIRTEDEWLSSINTGEAMLGTVSPLGMNLLSFCIEILIAKSKWVNLELWNTSLVPYFPKFLVYSHYHMMYSLADGILRFQSKSECSFFKILPLVLNFKHDAEEDMQYFISSRHGKSHLSFETIWHCFMMLLFSGSQSKLLEEKIQNEYLKNTHLKEIDSALGVINIVSYHYQSLTEPFICYMDCVYTAVFWNMCVLDILGKIRGGKCVSYDLQMDFNFLMSALSVPEEEGLILDLLALSNRIASNIEPVVFKKWILRMLNCGLKMLKLIRK